MTNLIFFCTSLLIISTVLVIFLLRSSIFSKKVLITSISISILTATIYIFKSDLKSFTYLNDLKNNIEQGNDINANEVIIFLEKKLNKNPKDIDAWLVLARTCLITGHIQKSELYYFKALKYFPENQDLLLETAILKKSNFDFENSITYVNKLLNLYPENIPAKMLYIELMLHTGELKKANRSLNELSKETDLDSSWLEKLNDIKSN